MSSDTDRRWLTIALALIGLFMSGEVVVGVLSGSLALLSDAAHMLTDAGAIVLALVAMRIAARTPGGQYTYGLKRAEILSALANGLTMLLLAGWLGVEAVRRLVSPPPVVGSAVLVTAVVGIGVNLAATKAIARANRTSLNVRGAYLHILTDLFAFIATAVAGLVMITTGFSRADGVATLVVVALMAHAGVGLVRRCVQIFLEAAPAHLDPVEVGTRVAKIPGVVRIHDFHIWQITSNEPALSAHVLVLPDHDCHAACLSIERVLRDEYDIHHSTLQIDHVEDRSTASRHFPGCPSHDQARQAGRRADTDSGSASTRRHGGQ